MSDLPEWKKDNNGDYYCDDKSVMPIAFYCELMGFDLPEFDEWVKKLEGQPKQFFLERRNELFVLIREKNSNAAKYLINFISTRRWNREREEFLLPLARQGDKTIKGRAKGSQRSKNTWAQPIADKYIKYFEQGKTKKEIWEKIPENPVKLNSAISYYREDENLYVDITVEGKEKQKQKQKLKEITQKTFFNKYLIRPKPKAK